MDKFIVHLPRGLKRAAVVGGKENSQDVTSSKRPKQQMYIDLGQKSFGKSSVCPKCDLIYIVGDLEDEKQHKKHCYLKNSAPFFGTCDKYTTIATLDDDGRILSPPLKALQTDKCLQNLAHQMHNEFGYSLDSLFSSAHDHDVFSVYVRLSDGCAVGCLVHERIPKRNCAPLTKEAKVSEVEFNSDDSRENANVLQIEVAANDDDFMLGVRYLWVHESFRCKRIASELVDAARKFSCFGTIVPKENIAFSQPTEAGRCFALKYVKAENILVYK